MQPTPGASNCNKRQGGQADLPRGGRAAAWWRCGCENGGICHLGMRKKWCTIRRGAPVLTLGLCGQSAVGSLMQPASVVGCCMFRMFRTEPLI